MSDSVIGHSQPIFNIRQVVNLTYLANTQLSVNTQFKHVLHNDPMICSDFHLFHGVTNEIYFFIRDSARLPMQSGNFTLNLRFDDDGLLQSPMPLWSAEKGIYLMGLSPDIVEQLPLGPQRWSVSYLRGDGSMVLLWTEHDSPYGVVYVHESPVPEPMPTMVVWEQFSPLLTGQYYSSALRGAGQNSFTNEQTMIFNMSGFTGTVRIDGSLNGQPDSAAEAPDWSEVESFDYRDFTGEDSSTVSGNYVWLRAMVKPKSGTFNYLKVHQYVL